MKWIFALLVFGILFGCLGQQNVENSSQIKNAPEKETITTYTNITVKYYYGEIYDCYNVNDGKFITKTIINEKYFLRDDYYHENFVPSRNIFEYYGRNPINRTIVVGDTLYSLTCLFYNFSFSEPQNITISVTT